MIQIETQGSFRDPEIGQASASGSGSGFIISPDGLAVTNNHVVTGAATLEVYVGGDRETSYNAQVLGVSECSDLALIQIDADEELPYLDWYDGDITAGLDVYAAGYPLGDPEFTLTRGIVTKAEADGDITGSSSIDHTVEHDASTHPGNSGGPIVSSDGDVVAVHYAGLSLDSGIQKFGIASDLAQPVVDRLQDGDYEALGINGWAVVDEEQGLSGIWVAGVEPGSPAADARDPGRRHRHDDERPAGRQRRHVPRLLRHHPHRRRGQPDRRRGAALRHLGGAARRDQRRWADRAGVLVRRRGQRRGR